MCHGVYTNALLRALASDPSQDLRGLFQRVATQVREATGGEQTPWLASSPAETASSAAIRRSAPLRYSTTQLSCCTAEASCRKTAASNTKSPSGIRSRTATTRRLRGLSEGLSERPLRGACSRAHRPAARRGIVERAVRMRPPRTPRAPVAPPAPARSPSAPRRAPAPRHRAPPRHATERRHPRPLPRRAVAQKPATHPPAAGESRDCATCPIMIAVAARARSRWAAIPTIPPRSPSIT